MAEPAADPSEQPDQLEEPEEPEKEERPEVPAEPKEPQPIRRQPAAVARRARQRQLRRQPHRRCGKNWEKPAIVIGEGCILRGRRGSRRYMSHHTILAPDHS